jgi:hypothetical protein
VIDLGAIQQTHFGKGAPILVLAKGLEHDFFPIDQGWRSLLGLLAIGVTFLRAVDAAEADTLSPGVVRDFDGVAVALFNLLVKEVKESRRPIEQSRYDFAVIVVVGFSDYGLRFSTSFLDWVKLASTVRAWGGTRMRRGTAALLEGEYEWTD